MLKEVQKKRGATPTHELARDDHELIIKESRKVRRGDTRREEIKMIRKPESKIKQKSERGVYLC